MPRDIDSIWPWAGWEDSPTRGWGTACPEASEISGNGGREGAPLSSLSVRSTEPRNREVT